MTTPNDNSTQEAASLHALDMPGDVMREGGEWLAATRRWLQSHTLNGETVTWGSDEVMRPGLTARHVEEIAAAAVAADRRTRVNAGEPSANSTSDAVGGGGVGGEKLCKPRKPHRCRLCNQRIEIGEPCHRYSGLEPGEGYYTIYLHPECERFTAKWDVDDWECTLPGDVVRPKVWLGVAGERMDVCEQSGAGSTTGLLSGRRGGNGDA